MNALAIGHADKLDFVLSLKQPFLFIDPHGTLAEGVLKRLDPQKTCYLNQNDTDFPFGFTPTNISEALNALFPEGENTLARAQSTFVLETARRMLERPTLLDILNLLSDGGGYSDDPVVLQNWKAIQAKNFDTARGLLQSRLGTLLIDTDLRNILCTKQTFQFGKMIVAHVGKFIGALLIASSKGQVVINDMGYFGMNLPLSENRYAILCNTLDDLQPELKRGVLGIDKTVYRLNLKDAEEMSFYVGVLNPRLLTELDGPLHPLPPPPPARFRISSHKKRSRARHTRPKSKVEAALRRYFAP